MTTTAKHQRKESLRTLCSRPLISIGQDATVEEALDLMLRNSIEHLPVLGGRYLVGLLTRRALVDAPRSKPIQHLMTAPVPTLSPDQSEQDAVALMLDRDIDALVVVEEQRPYGMLTRRDLQLAKKSSKQTPKQAPHHLGNLAPKEE